MKYVFLVLLALMGCGSLTAQQPDVWLTPSGGQLADAEVNLDYEGSGAAIYVNNPLGHTIVSIYVDVVPSLTGLPPGLSFPKFGNVPGSGGQYGYKFQGSPSTVGTFTFRIECEYQPPTGPSRFTSEQYSIEVYSQGSGVGNTYPPPITGGGGDSGGGGGDDGEGCTVGMSNKKLGNVAFLVFVLSMFAVCVARLITVFVRVRKQAATD